MLAQPALTAIHLALTQRNRILYANMCCQFNPGEIWGILGLNGAGKTTLLHSLAGLIPKQQRHVCLNQTPLSQLSSKARAQQIGILFQEFIAPFPQTVWDYCADARFPHRAAFFKKNNKNNKNNKNTTDMTAHQLIHQALATMGLASCRARQIAQLSGGEKRRLAIAALLAQSPHIYLLDEPTHHLDLPFQHQLLLTCQQLAADQKIVLIATHDLNLVERYCTHVLLLLPAGYYVHGSKADYLTADYLTQVYLHPLIKIDYNQHTFWQFVPSTNKTREKT